MSDELDLEKGDPDRAEEISARERRRRARRDGGSATSSKGGNSQRTSTSDFRGQLGRVLEKLVEQREAVGDDELATALRDNKDPMVQGFASVTSSVPFLQTPFLLVLNLLEIVLAFGAVGRILVGRAIERRNRRMQERPPESEQPWEPEQPATIG